MVDSLDRVVLAVPELEAAIRQYVRLLGRTPSWRGEQPAAGTHNALFRLGNTVLEILAPQPGGSDRQTESSPSQLLLAGTPSVAAWLDEYGPGLLALAFGTDDADACYGALAERGLRPNEIVMEVDRDVDSGAFRRCRRVSLALAATRGVWLSAVEYQSPDGVLVMAAPLCDEHSTVHAVDHVVVQTRDPDGTRELFGEGLGLRIALDREFPQWGSRLLFFRVGGVTIEVAARLEDASSEEAAGGQSVASDAPADRDRLWGLCWRVADAASAQARMLAAGFDVSDVRDGRKPGTRVFTVRDGTCGVPTLVLEA